MNPTGARPRLRVALVTLAVQALFLWWIADSEIARSVYLICYALMLPTALFLVFGGLVRKVTGLTRAELLFVYIVLTSTLPIAGFGAVRYIALGMAYLPFAAGSDPGLAPYVAAWSTLPTVHDPAAVAAFFKGGAILWKAWLPAVGLWSAYLLLAAGAWLGLAANLRRLWIHHERLTFPIAQLPLELTEAKNDLWRRPLFWAGVAIPTVLQSLLVLHDWWPTIPAFTLKAQDFRPQLFPNLPWSTIPDVPIGWYPMAVGLAYLMPGAVAFSCLFFWLALRLAHPLAFSLGFDPAGMSATARFPYLHEQAAGAWIAMAGLSLWGVRAGRKIADADAAPADLRDERWMGNLALVFLAAAAGIMTWVGLPPAIAAGTAVVYAAYVLTGARMRAETGAIWTFAPLTWTPGRVAAELFRAAPLGLTPLLAGALFDLLHVDIRGQSLPFVMEGLKIGESVGLRWRTVLGWIALFTLTALAMSWWFQLQAFHTTGAATAKSNAFVLAKVRVGFSEMQSLAARPSAPDRAGLGGVLGGGVITALLVLLRARFVGFPLHPVGYVLGLTLTMNAFFVPTLIAYVTKTLVLRYGGSDLYRRSVGFFVGVTLGDIGAQTFWTLVGRLFDVPIYQFLS